MAVEEEYSIFIFLYGGFSFCIGEVVKSVHVDGRQSAEGPIYVFWRRFDVQAFNENLYLGLVSTARMLVLAKSIL